MAMDKMALPKNKFYLIYLQNLETLKYMMYWLVIILFKPYKSHVKLYSDYM
jgi:hypothetical protein